MPLFFGALLFQFSNLYFTFPLPQNPGGMGDRLLVTGPRLCSLSLAVNCGPLDPPRALELRLWDVGDIPSFCPLDNLQFSSQNSIGPIFVQPAPFFPRPIHPIVLFSFGFSANPRFTSGKIDH